MIKFSLYDFDKTIYSKDTGIEIIKRLFVMHPKTILYIPIILGSFLLYLCRLITTRKLKELFFLPISSLTLLEWEYFIQKFWEKEQRCLFSTVLEQIKQDQRDGYKIGVLSASAECFLTPIINQLPIDFLIGTKFDIQDNKVTSTVIGENCKGQEKVHRLTEYLQKFYVNQPIVLEKMYSDSLNDLPLFDICHQKFAIDAQGNIVEGLPKPNNNI